MLSRKGSARDGGGGIPHWAAESWNDVLSQEAGTMSFTRIEQCRSSVQPRLGPALPFLLPRALRLPIVKLVCATGMAARGRI